VALKQCDKALPILAKALSLDSEDAEVYHNIGACHQDKGTRGRDRELLKEAVDHFERALRYDRRRADTYYRLGMSYFDLDEGRRAARALTAATHLAKGKEPWLADAYLNLGYIQRNRNKNKEAAEAFEAYLDLSSKKDSAQEEEVRRLLLILR